MTQSLQPCMSDGVQRRVLCADFDRPVSDYQNGPDHLSAGRMQDQWRQRG